MTTEIENTEEEVDWLRVMVGKEDMFAFAYIKCELPVGYGGGIIVT